jgi:hypothetical protein
VADIFGAEPPPIPADTTWLRVGDPAAPFSLEVPSSWSSARAVPWIEADGSSSGVVLLAGPDPEALGSDFSQPAVGVGVTSNPNGLTPRQVVESEGYGASCTASPVEEQSDIAFAASYQVWTSCGGEGDAFLLVLAIAPTDSPGLLGIVYQGASQVDLAYIEHIMSSLGPATGSSAPTPGPGTVETPSPGPVAATSRSWTASLDECLLQMNDAIAYGTVTNTDDRSHGYRVYVRFVDASGLLLGESYWDTPAVDPGQAARYEVRLLAVNGVTEATCMLGDVLVRD